MPLALLASLIPKCPLCLAAWAAALGLTRVADIVAAHLDDRLLAVPCVAALVGAIAIFSMRRGAAGAAVAGASATIILSGRLVAGNATISAGGVALLAAYVAFSGYLRGRQAALPRSNNE